MAVNAYHNRAHQPTPEQGKTSVYAKNWQAEQIDRFDGLGKVEVLDNEAPKQPGHEVAGIIAVHEAAQQ